MYILPSSRSEAHNMEISLCSLSGLIALSALTLFLPLSPPSCFASCIENPLVPASPFMLLTVVHRHNRGDGSSTGRGRPAQVLLHNGLTSPWPVVNSTQNLRLFRLTRTEVRYLVLVSWLSSAQGVAVSNCPPQLNISGLKLRLGTLTARVGP